MAWKITYVQTNFTALWNSLAASAQQQLRVLALFENYITIEETILQQFLNAVNDSKAFPKLKLVKLQQSLQIALEMGWAKTEPGTRLLQLNPLFTSWLKRQFQLEELQNLEFCFLDFYSAFANYIQDVYLDSGDEDLWEEGLKLVFFEMHNLRNALIFAIQQREDFIHIFNVIDAALALDESHPTRLQLVKDSLLLLGEPADLPPAILIQRKELDSFLGDILYRMGRKKEAKEIYLNTLDFFQREKVTHAEAMLCNNLANLLADEGDFAAALQHYERAIVKTNEMADLQDFQGNVEETLLKNHLNLGYCYYQLKQYQNAQTQYQKALTFANEEEPSVYLGDLYMRIGLVHYRQKDWATAQQTYLNAVDVYYKLHHTFGIGEVNQNMGLLLSEYGDDVAALENYDQALSIFIYLQDLRAQAQVYNNIAHIKYHAGDFEVAAEYYLRGQAAAASVEDELTEALCTMGLGSVALEQHQLQLAEPLFSQAQATFFRFSDLAALADVDLNFSGLFLLKEEWGQAYLKGFQAWRSYYRLEQTKEMALALANMAQAQAKLDNLTKSTKCYRLAAQLMQNHDLPLAYEYFQQTGAGFFEMGNFLESRQHYFQALQLALQLQADEAIGYTAWSLASISDQLNDSAQALSFFDQAFHHFSVAQNQAMMAASAHAMGIAIAQSNLIGKASYYLTVALQLYDSLEDKDSIEQVKLELKKLEMIG